MRIIVFTMKRLLFAVQNVVADVYAGASGVWMMNGLALAWGEVPIDLPTVRSEEVLFVFPVERKNMHAGGGGGGGSSCHDPDVQARFRADAAKYGFVRGVWY